MCRRPAVSTSSTSRPVCIGFALRAERASSSGVVSSGGAVVDGQLEIACQDAQLLAGGGTVDVHRHHHGRWPFLDSQRASLPVEVVLPEPCRPTIIMTVGGSLAVRSRAWCWPRHLDHFVADDLDDLLRRGERGEHFLAHSLFPDGFDELLDDLEVDVGFEQRHANFAQSGFHVLGGELSLAAQVLEDALQLVAKIIEHGDYRTCYLQGGL